MSAELRIRRAAALGGLVDDEVLAGYHDGLDSNHPPEGATFSYMHGWRNGMSDKGRREIDECQRELAKDVVDTGYLKRLARK
jgi:hypothetical protein